MQLNICSQIARLHPLDIRACRIGIACRDHCQSVNGCERQRLSTAILLALGCSQRAIPSQGAAFHPLHLQLVIGTTTSFTTPNALVHDLARHARHMTCRCTHRAHGHRVDSKLPKIQIELCKEHTGAGRIQCFLWLHYGLRSNFRMAERFQRPVTSISFWLWIRTFLSFNDGNAQGLVHLNTTWTLSQHFVR